MNCKPGDLCFIIKDEGEVMSRANVGKVVTVIDQELSEGNEWRCVCNHAPILCEMEFSYDLQYVPAGVPEIWIPDANLKPICDPGDDAKDESMAWLPPVPHKEIA